ncbi:hypothetical protein C2S51_006212 [Perilla frutescens var. frutescens]|nr:hypothetical protein C2S51_006212 [Perilla frutescens var. frutescens]
MDSILNSAGAITPAKEKTAARSKFESARHSENVNPNVSSPAPKFSNSPSIGKSEKSAKKSASRNPKQLCLASPSPKKKIRERKFVIAKKKGRNQEQSSLGAAAVACEKCKKAIGKSKCLCVAYETLRASQEDFFKNRDEIIDEVFDKLEDLDLISEKGGVEPEIEKGFERKMEGNGVLSEINNNNVDNSAANDDIGVKRSRDKLLEEAKVRVRTPGSGKVMNLVKEFEKLSMLKLGDSEEKDVEEAENDKSGVDLALDRLEQRPKALETQVSSSSFCPSNFYLTSESLGLDARRSYSLDSNEGSISTMASAGGRKNRRSSTESAADRARRQWKRKQLRVTSQKPFMLRTEERGRCKEEEFLKKLQQMVEEEERMRIPVAQGLPWTTDEPECLVKPPVKERTRPVDLVLHSDVRAVDRSEFDQQVAMKLNLIEQYRMERERQQKLAEEEEIRRLRKELVPKAQPMPYFDRPFIPRRSEKNPTVPKEPKFKLPQNKKIKCNLSLDDFAAHCQ